MSVEIKIKSGGTEDFKNDGGEPYEVAYNRESKKTFIWDPELKEWIDTYLDGNRLEWDNGCIVVAQVAQVAQEEKK